MAEEIINIEIIEDVENINIVVDEIIEEVTISIQEISKTSDLINDGKDGIHPFITIEDVPPLTGYANTSYVDTQDALKVDKVIGKSLIADTEITRLAGVTNFDNSGNVTALANKVDKVTGKGLSTNDLTNALKTAYDNAVSWITINGTNLINHLTNYSNPHNTTASQVGAEPTITAGTTSQYWRGDKSWQTLPSYGIGDMLKSTYDVDNTGVVDNAEAIQIIGRNSTGATLYKGTVVYISGSTGNRPNFVKSQANAEATSAGTFGVIANDLANNADGYAVCIGYLDNLDTRSTATHPFTADTLADGDTIYLSPTNAGYITNIKPSAPNHLVYLGKVTRTSPTNGTIVYRIQNGYELEELHNVAIATPTNEDFLQYESSTLLWKNIQITSAWLRSKLIIQEYASNQAALDAGLQIGNLYHTSGNAKVVIEGVTSYINAFKIRVATDSGTYSAESCQISTLTALNNI